MPVRDNRRTVKRLKRKRSLVDRIPGSKIAANTVKDLEDVARGTPAGVVHMGKSLKGLNPLYLARNRRAKDNPTVELAKQMGQQTIEDFRHPLRHPGYTLLDILGLAPLLGTPFKAARLARGVKTKPPTRTIKHKVRSTQESDRFKKALGVKSKGALKEIKQEVPASRRFTTRGAQKALDKLREKSPTMSRRKMEKIIARKQDVRGRLFDENPKGVIGATKEAFGTTAPVKKLNPTKKGGTYEIMRDANALIRGLRLYRGAYVPPNRLGAEAVTAIHSPTAYGKQAFKNIKGRRRKDRPTAETIDRLGGETTGQAMMETGAQGPVGTFMRGVGTTLGKVTDRGPRERVWRTEAERLGYTDADIPALLNAAKNGNPKALQDLYLITERAENASIRFSRLGPMRDAETGNKLSGFNPLQTADRALADNIFLYKWLTGSTRYGGHMLGEHPTLMALLAQGSREAPGIDSILEEYPSFMGNYIPAGEREGGVPEVRNPTAAGLFDMPFETLRVARNSAGDLREASDALNPVQAMLMNALTGFDPFRDQEISEFNDSPLERAKFGAGTQLRSIPWLEWGRLDDSPEDRENRLFPLTPMDIILRQLVGSSLTPTGFPVNKKVARSMGRKEKRKGKPKRRRQNAGYSF